MKTNKNLKRKPTKKETKNTSKVVLTEKQKKEQEKLEILKEREKLREKHERRLQRRDRREYENSLLKEKKKLKDQVNGLLIIQDTSKPLTETQLKKIFPVVKVNGITTSICTKTDMSEHIAITNEYLKKHTTLRGFSELQVDKKFNGTEEELQDKILDKLASSAIVAIYFSHDEKTLPLLEKVNKLKIKTYDFSNIE